jgi:hypothetical protein
VQIFPDQDKIISSRGWMIRRIGYLLGTWIIGVFGSYQVYNNPVGSTNQQTKARSST